MVNAPADRLRDAFAGFRYAEVMLKRMAIILMALGLLLAACEDDDASPLSQISKQEAIHIALEDLRTRTEERPSEVSATLDEVLADADGVKERVWVVRMELKHGAEEGAYIDPTTGEILGGFDGSP